MRVVQSDDLRGQPSAIEPIDQHIDAGSRHNQAQPFHFFGWIEGISHQYEGDGTESPVSSAQSTFTTTFVRAQHNSKQVALAHRKRTVTNRPVAPLPRILQGWKDSEELGADRLLMANLKDRVKQTAASVYENRLVVDKLVAVDSQSSVFLQVADIMASSANRILSRTGESRNHKDELAEYLLERLGISLTPDLEVLTGDLAAHIKI